MYVTHSVKRITWLLCEKFCIKMLLPPKWVENSIENYISQTTTKSQMIYWVVLAAIVLAFILMPFIYVDISVQSNGVIRPANEKTEIKATVSEIINEVTTVQ